MEVAAAALVVIGYVIALPVVFRMRAVFHERRARWFAIFEVGMAIIVVGHALSGRPLAAGINAVGALVMAAAWREMGRRRRQGQASS